MQAETDEWILSSSGDKRALAVVDGLGKFRRYGPHYSRRTPGSKTFTGVGQEIVLLHVTGRAVWAVIRQKTPSRPGTGASRGREGTTDARATYVWRNMMFCNRYAGVASDLIMSATIRTYEEWRKQYGELPPERMRTEVDVRKVKSKDPGRCYVLAGWEKGLIKRGKLFLYAPPPLEHVGVDDPLIARGAPREAEQMALPGCDAGMCFL